MTIETELMKIKGDDEFLIAEVAIDWAKANRKSELYKALEWDDRTAGHEYRLWQVRRLIALHITYEDGQRRFVSLSVDRKRDNGGYRDINAVLRDKGLHEIMLSDALAELNRIELRYDQLKQLKPIWREVAKLRRKYASRKSEHRSTA